MHSTETFKFTSSDGTQLDGRLERPRYGTPRAVAIFAHCFTCGKDSRAATFITRALAAKGVMVLRFDFAGLGGSVGDLAGFATHVDDLKAAADALSEKGHPPSLLIGHSLGGAAVIAAAGKIDSVTAVATLGAPADTDHVLQNLGDKREVVEREGEAVVKIAGREFEVKKRFIEETAGQLQEEHIAKLHKPLLIMHSPTDELVSIDNASKIFNAAKHPKSFLSLDGADHLLMDDKDAYYAANVIAAWSERYISSLEEMDDDPPLDGTVRVETAGGKFAQLFATPSHEFILDEPKSIGGNDDGPTPYDLLLGAIGGCTAMTVQMYADRKKWPLEKVTVELEHNRDHAQDCLSDAAGGDDKIEVIDKAIRFEGDLDEEQRARLMEIADKCPVHRTITGDLHIHSTLVK
ncbi:bifunctional alpha/beta hydrolase/OsmC family protein [Sphingomicrobium marinum]|uniref:bifunctional alpha/beta hydrolase/OsmC family protein n=1 Tax=Sphingomicrobium marinum TaxID=1227950 RepID=UPI00223F2B95|nr:bifunctional alpha/beta hydrolase/OsmC family protein [Sphingomicrobium marinum]